MIDFSLELGILPWITLYHWDLPHALEKKGGWVNREIIDWFGNYVDTCIKYFGDRVRNWMILNEPMVFTGAGYFVGIHAPGKKGLSNFLAAAHHAVLCQSFGARIIKSQQSHHKVGTTFSCSHIEPFTANEHDVNAAKKVDTLLNRFFIEPLPGMGYPVKDLPLLKSIEKFIKPGDEQALSFQMDFIGIQNYTREIVRHSHWVPFINARIVKTSQRKVASTLMNWEVYPEALYQMLKKFGSYQNIPN